MSNDKDEIRIALLENNHKNLMEKIDNLLKRFDKFDEKLDEALKGKANIWVEKAFTWGIYFIASIIITAVMYLIIKK